MKTYLIGLCALAGIIGCKKDNNNDDETHSTLKDGLVAQYSFTGNALDSTSNHNDGTGVGIGLTTDRWGNVNQAYLFNGTSSYISIPKSASLDLKGSFSISAWVRPDNYQIPGIIVWHGDAAYAKDPFLFYFSNRPGYNAIGVRKDANDGLMINETYAPSTAMFSGVWSHVVGICDSASKVEKLYINGELIASGSFSDMSINYTTDNFITMIGAATSTAGIEGYFKGKLDEVRIYNRVLTTGEIKELSSL